MLIKNINHEHFVHCLLHSLEWQNDDSELGVDEIYKFLFGLVVEKLNQMFAHGQWLADPEIKPWLRTPLHHPISLQCSQSEQMQTGQNVSFFSGARDDASCESSFVSRCGVVFSLLSGTRLPPGCAGAVRAQKPRKPQGLGKCQVATGGGGAQ